MLIGQCLSARFTCDSGPASGQQLERMNGKGCGLQEDLGCHIFWCSSASLVLMCWSLPFRKCPAVECRDDKNKAFTVTRMQSICTLNESCYGEIQSTVDIMIRNVVLTDSTKLHRLPRGHPASGWCVTLMMCKHPWTPCGGNSDYSPSSPQQISNTA